MLALAILAFVAATATPARPRTGTETPTPAPIALTVNEIRRLIDALVLDRPRPPTRILHWSFWRRQHQARARTCHYQRRLKHHQLGGSGTGAVLQIAARFPSVKPCMRFSRTRLTDVLHRRRSVLPRQSRKGLGGITVPSRLIRPRWSGDNSTCLMPHPQALRRLPLLDNISASRIKA